MSWKPSLILTTAPAPGVVVVSSSIAALGRVSDESSGSESEQHVLQHQQQSLCSVERNATDGPLPMRALTELLLSATAEVADQQRHTFVSQAAVKRNRHRHRHRHHVSPLLEDTPLNTTVAGDGAGDGAVGGYHNAEGAELSLVRQWKWDILLAKRPHDLTDAKATSEWLEEVLAISDTKRSLGATRRAAMLSSTIMTNPSTRTPHQTRPTNQITTPEMYISDLSDSGGEEAEDVRRYYTTSDAIHHHHKQQHINNNNNKNSSNDHHRHVRRRKQAVMEEDDGGPKIFYNIKEPRQKRRKHRHHYDHQY